MAPWRRLAIRTPTLRATRNVPRKSMLISRSQLSMRTRWTECILPNTPAALTRPVIGPWAASMSAMPRTTAASSATSNASGHRMVCVPVRASGTISTITMRCPCRARRVAVAAPMPRLPPVTRTMPSAIMIVAFAARHEQPPRDQLLVGRDHMVRHRGDGIAGIGITAAEVAARAHEHMNDGFEFLVAEIVDRAGMPRTPENPDIGRRDIVEMLLVADRCEKLGLVEDAQEFRDLTDEIEEGAKSLDFLPRRVRRTGSLPDETYHFRADHGQQLIQQLLAILKMIVKRALRNDGLL